MDFDLKPEHEMFRKSVREFARREIAPLAEEADKQEKYPKELFPKMGELGYLCITCPEKYGGPGGDKITECIFMEEAAYVSLGIAIPAQIHSAFAGGLMLHYGSEEQKERYLPPAIKGKEIWAFAATEPDCGSDRSMIKANVRREGDHFILNGTKMFITNPPFADYTIVQARTDKTKGLSGLSHFIVKKGTPGFKISKLSKLGIRAAEMAELSFEDCILPKESELGEPGMGLEKVRRITAASWILIGARSIGVARAAFDAALEYSKTRVQFNKPIGLFQGTGFKLADMALDIDMARLLTYRAAWLYDQGRDSLKEASMAKLFTSEMAVRVTGQALQIHGALGYMMESPVQRYFRDAKMLTISEGPSEIQHIVIAQELGLKADDNVNW